MEPWNNNKSLQESIVLKSFRKHFPEFPKGRLIKSESPDFILKTKSKHAIGIELTALPSFNYNLSNENYNDFISDLVQTISKKEQKLEIYLKMEAEAYWLVIYADSMEAHGLNLSNHIDKLTVGSGFDRVFLFGLFEGKVWEITTPSGYL